MKKKIIFVTGIGTGVGKTFACAVLCKVLKADYWKPIQAGFEDGTDAEWIQQSLQHNIKIHPSVYQLKLPTSPHIAARAENVQISIDEIVRHFHQLEVKSEYLIIEGAGGILVPISDNQFISDLIQALNAQVLLVSRNYLGSINHSLLTAQFCKQQSIEVAGWIFNDQYLNYEDEIAAWSGFPKIFSIPFCNAGLSDLTAQQLQAFHQQLSKHLHA